MSVYISMNLNRSGGQGGEIDPFRVLSVSSPQSNDFAPEVLFSALWPTQQVEKTELAINLPAAGTNVERTGTWNPTRKFYDIPLVMGVYRSNGGAYSYPHGYTQAKKGNQPSSTWGLEALDSFLLTCTPRGGNLYSVGWQIQQLNSWDLGGPGVLRLFVMGAPP